MLLKCTKCLETKDSEHFAKKNGSKHGRASLCKICRKVYDSDRYSREKETRSLQNRKWAISHREKVQDYNLKYKYTLHPGDYQKLFEKQNGKCLICLETSKENKRLHVDHCGVTGRIRGLLCFTCNTGIAKFKHDPLIIEKAIKYIKKYITC